MNRCRAALQLAVVVSPRYGGQARGTTGITDTDSLVACCVKTDSSTLPDVVTATLPWTGTYYVTVTELPKSSRFKGAYSVSLESTKAAWSTFK